MIADPGVGPLPRSLALLGLGRLQWARGDAQSALNYVREVQKQPTEDWVLEKAELLLSELNSTDAEQPEDTVLKSP